MRADGDSTSFHSARHQLSHCGFCLLLNFLEPRLLDDLREEAVGAFENALFSQRDGDLAYEAYMADLGPVARHYLQSQVMLDLVKSLTGFDYELVGGRSCYTYYLEGGFLSPHLDRIEGDKPFTVLTYIWVEDAQIGGGGLYLDVYSERSSALSPFVSIPTLEGSVVLGHGSMVRHGRQRLSEKQKLIVVNGSFARSGISS